MLSNAANVATIAGTGLAVWAALARVLTRARRRRVSDFLSRGDVQLIAIIGGGFAMAFTTIILLQLENGSLLREHSADLAAFNTAAMTVERTGANIIAMLRTILSELGK